MAVKILATRGTEAQIQAVSSASQRQGQIAYATDTKEFYVSDGTQFNKITDLESNGNFYVDGNVGIGTTSPSSKLHLLSTTHSTFLDNGILLDVDSSDEGEPAIAFRNQSDMGSNYWIAGINNGGQNLDFAYGTVFTSANTNVRFTSDGNVGIGTINPASKLTVNGGNIRRTHDANNYSQMGAGSEGGFINGYSGNSEKFIIRSYASNGVQAFFAAGNVGIGTTSPSVGLHVYSTSGIRSESAGNASVQIMRSDNVQYSALLRYYSGNSEKWVAGLSDAGDFTGSTGEEYIIGTLKSNPLVVLKNNGNLGIGTTSPNALLELKSSSTTDFLKLTSVNSGANPIKIIFEKSAAEQGVIEYNRNGDLEIYNTDNDGGVLISGSGSATADMYINHSGNVGIGTTSAGRKLTIAGTDNLLFLDSSGNSYLTIDRSATNRRSALVFSTAGDGTSNIPNNINWALGSADSDEVGDGTGFFINTNTSATSAKLFITSTGNVGIGTTSPARLLHVDGSSGARISYESANMDLFYYGIEFNRQSNYLRPTTNSGKSLYIGSGSQNYTWGTVYLDAAVVQFRNSSSEPLMRFDSSTGRLGIGTTSPSEKLHISSGGNIRVDGSEIYITQASSSRKPVRLHQASYKGAITLQRDGVDNVHISSDLAFQGHTYFNGLNTNVGIGTATPSEKLEIGTDGGGENKLRINSDVATKYLQFESLGNLSRIKATNAQNLLLESTGAGGYITFNANSAERMRILYNGNVGIGTTSPLAKLHVEGTGALLDLANNASGNTYLRFKDGTGNKFALRHMVSADYLGVYDYNEGSDTLVITGSNVGIGTTSPTEKLHVNGNLKFMGSRSIGTTASADDLSILPERDLNLGTQASDNVYIGRGTTWAGKVVIQANAANTMVVTDNKVGIGTTSPSSPLTVAGRVDFQNDLRLRGTDSASNQGVTRFFVDSSNRFHIDTANDGNNNFVIDSVGKVGIGTTNPYATLTVAGNITQTDNSYLISTRKITARGAEGLALYNNGGQGIDIKDNNNVIVTSGNVGIGTTSPTSTLHVAGTARIHSAANGAYGTLTLGSINDIVGDVTYIDFKNNGSSWMRIINGNVGIGTTNPTSKFHVEGTSKFVGQGTWSMRMENNVSSGQAELALWTVTDAYAQSENFSLVATPHPNISSRPIWYFQASGDGWRDMTLQRYGGRVGIRTLNPSANLTVQGSGTTTGKTFLAQNSNASALFTILDSGKVGIGTTSPSTKFHVDGNIRVGDANDVIYTNKLHGLSIGDLTLYTSGNTLLTQTGNVGIGTTSPSATLDIENANGVTIDINSSSGDGQFRFQDEGVTKWAIGRDNTQQNFVFSNTAGLGSDPVLVLEHGTGNVDLTGNLTVTKSSATIKVIETGGGDVRMTAGGATGYIGTYNNNSLQLVQNGSVALFVDTSRNVGIGTTSPTSALQVVGRTKTSELHASNGNAIYTNQGSIAMGTSQVDASAVLNIVSTTKGVLFPRMTETQRTAISSPATGLIVYQTDSTEGLYIYKSTGWTQII
jgi:hypothetical protein